MRIQLSSPPLTSLDILQVTWPLTLSVEQFLTVRLAPHCADHVKILVSMVLALSPMSIEWATHTEQWHFVGNH